MTSTFLVLGGLLSSIVDSLLVKSTWTSSSGVCTLMGHRGALGTAPSNVRHLRQPHTRALPSLATKNVSVPGPMFFADPGGCVVMNTIQSHCILTGGNQEGQQPFYLSLGHRADVQQSFAQDQSVTHMEESASLLCICLAAQVFLQ